MRAVVFRCLAGVLGVLFCWFLIFADHSRVPMRQLVWMHIMAVGFVLYALFGPKPVEAVLGLLAPTGRPKPPGEPPAE